MIRVESGGVVRFCPLGRALPVFGVEAGDGSDSDMRAGREGENDRSHSKTPGECGGKRGLYLISGNSLQRCYWNPSVGKTSSERTIIRSTTSNGCGGCVHRAPLFARPFSPGKEVQTTGTVPLYNMKIAGEGSCLPSILRSDNKLASPKPPVIYPVTAFSTHEFGSSLDVCG